MCASLRLEALPGAQPQDHVATDGHDEDRLGDDREDRDPTEGLVLAHRSELSREESESDLIDDLSEDPCEAGDECDPPQDVEPWPATDTVPR